MSNKSKQASHGQRKPAIDIPQWSQDKDGGVIPNRTADFWDRRPGKAVHCDLCYRKCDIPQGEAGWCKYRRNEAGGMVIPEHGTLARFSRQILGYGGGQRTYCPGALGMGICSIRCTSRCSFCTSDNVVWNPDKLEWQGGRERNWGSRGRARIPRC